MSKEIVELQHLDVVVNAIRVAELIKKDFKGQLENSNFDLRVFPVPRGGIPCAYLVAGILGGNIKFVDSAEEAQIIIDDIIDSGKTRDDLLKKNEYAKFYALFEHPSTWLSLPFERTLDGKDKSIEDAIIRLMEYRNIPLDEFESFKERALSC